MKKKKTRGSSKKLRPKPVLVTIAAMIVALFALGMLAGNYLYNFSLNAERKVSLGLDGKPPKQDGEAAADSGAEQVGLEGLFTDPAWLEEVGAKDEWIVSDDGLKLHALTVNAVSGGPWAVLIHGYSSSCEAMATFGKSFYERGYNLLMPDLRGHGQSEGSYRGMGWDDRLDVIRWIELLTAREPDCDVLLHGISMGGATVMMTSGEPLPHNVKAIIEDCGYTSVYDEFSYQLKNIFRLPAFPFMQFAGLVTQLRTGSRLVWDGSALEQVKKSRTPTLFIHGAEDTFVPFSMLDAVYEAASCEKERLVVEGAIHGMAFATDPELYWRTIDGFLDKHMGR